MTFNNNPFDLPHHSTVDLDGKPDTFDDLDSSLIDANMLSGAAMERKDSFATSTPTFFSPQSSTNPWGEESFTLPPSATQRDRHMSMSSQLADPIIGSNNPFLNQNFPHWSVYERAAETKTPMPPAVYESFVGEFDATSPTNFQPSVTVASPYNSGVAMMNNVRPASIMPPSAGTSSLSDSPTPNPGKEWMTLAENDLDVGRLPKRMRQHSPSRPLTPGFARRDGVRKKNARFDIPEGRNLHNIDHLIQQATTEEDVKELKQQKRLLRNRQAALDSRQRKKKHTEELEQEQKAWLDHRSEMESKLCMLQEQLDALKIHNEQVEHQRDELSAQVHVLSHEKESLVEEHTLETGNLRKRITTLTEQLERGPATAHSHSSHDFSDIDLDQLTMDNEWDNIIFNNMVDDDDDVEPRALNTARASNTTTLVVGKPRADTVMEDMPPLAPSGFLLMLLLYGAFVASKSNTNAPPMPGMSDEMRVASAHIVENILKDSNSASQTSFALTSTQSMQRQPVPSMPAWVQPDTAIKQNSINYNTVAPSAGASSRLDSLASNFVIHSKLAEDEAAFGLTAAQYNSMTSNDYGPSRTYLPDEDHDISSTTGRPRLADALRQMREDVGSRPVSEVYTRSLLWDRIPEHVLQDFRKLVDEGRA